MSNLPEEYTLQVKEVRNVSEKIIEHVGENDASVVVIGCLDAALKIVQGGAEKTVIEGIDILIEALYKMRAAVTKGSG